jgi:hypothetical protein
MTSARVGRTFLSDLLREIYIRGCPTLVAPFATEPALSEVEGVRVLTVPSLALVL